MMRKTMSAPASDGDRTFVADFVGELLTAEEKRRESLEARGSAVITVSGALVTLLLALTALVTRQHSFILPAQARVGLTFAVVAFVVAALLSIATYVPQPTRIADAAGLRSVMPTIWERDSEFWRKKIIATRLAQLEALQASNDRKAGALLGAVAAQVAAAGFLAWAVTVIL
jgi:hypothetical protein